MPDVTDSMAQPSSDQSPKPSAIEYEIAMYQNISYHQGRHPRKHSEVLFHSLNKYIKYQSIIIISNSLYFFEIPF